MKRLSNKVVIITGSGSGMGAQEAIFFANEGATVIVTDRDAAKGKMTASTISYLEWCNKAFSIPNNYVIIFWMPSLY